VRSDSHDCLLRFLLDLWEERLITSVANLTRGDGENSFKIASALFRSKQDGNIPLEDRLIPLCRFPRCRLKASAVLRSCR